MDGKHRLDKQSAEYAGCGPLNAVNVDPQKPLVQLMIECIRASGRISRSDVAKALGFSPGSVTAATAALMDAGLVREAEDLRREPGRGRPAVALSLVPEARKVVGITMREGMDTAVVAGFNGRQYADETLETRPGRRSLSEMLDDVEAIFDAAIAKSNLQRSEIAAIGLGVPGFVNFAQGVVHWSPLMKDIKVDLGRALTERLGVQVLVENDVNMLAIAESWFGVGRERPNFALVTIEQGVGMGLVLDNTLFRGTQGLGLELGHIIMQMDGALCRCGQRGCLEAYVADYALVREASTALDWDHRQSRSQSQMLEMLFEQAKAGNTAAQTIFARAGRFLSAGLANVIRIFDPELLILSGARLKYDYLYGEDVLSEMHRISGRIGGVRTEVQVHSWGELAWARGGVALALSNVTDQITRDLKGS